MSRYFFVIGVFTSSFLFANVNTELQNLYNKSKKDVQNSIEELNLTLDRHHNTFLQDAKLFSKESFFKTTNTGADAGTLLNALVVWDAEDVDSPEHKQKKLYLPQAVFKDENPPTLFKEPLIDIEKLDFSWMKELGAYSYWDIWTKAPSRCFLSHYSKQQLPNFKILRNWINLRYLKAARSNDPNDALAALQEVRQLLKLIFSVETVISSLVVVAQLQTEYHIWNYFKERYPKIAKKFVPLSAAALERAKRFFWGQKSYVDMFAKDSIKKANVPYLSLMCGGLSETGFEVSALMQFKVEDFSAEYLSSKKIIETSSCRLRFLRWMMSSPSNLAECASDNSATELHTYLSEVALALMSKTSMSPLIKSIQNVLLMGTTITSTLKLYEDGDAGLSKLSPLAVGNPKK